MINFNRHNNSTSFSSKQIKINKNSLNSEFISNSSLFLKRKSIYELKALDRFIAFMESRGWEATSYRILANIFGCSDNNAYKWTHKWSKEGLIEIHNGKQISYLRKEANSYKLSPYFSFQDVRSNLSHILPSLKFLPLLLLSVMNVFCCDQNNVYQNLNYISKRKVIRNLTLNNKIHPSAIRILEKIKWSEKMDEVTTIPSYINNVSSIKLTRSGKIRLSGYPSAAITFADVHIKRTKKFVKNPFSYFISLCDQYCKDYEIKPNWEQVELLKKIFGFRDSDAMLSSSAIYNKGLPSKQKATESQPILIPSCYQKPSPPFLKREGLNPETKSIKHSLDEINRRRNIQNQYAKPETYSSSRRPEWQPTPHIPAPIPHERRGIMSEKATALLAGWGIDPLKFAKARA